jgi:hypothetical protein
VTLASHPPGESPKSANARDLLQNMSLNRVEDFFIADVGISVINCDSERAIESFSRVTQLSPVDPSRSDAWNGISWAYFIAGSYDEGCLWATRALQHSSNAMSLGAFTANAVLAGRSSEAQEAAKHLGEIAPTFCASHAGDTIVFREPVVAAKMRAALRQAGLPD